MPPRRRAPPNRPTGTASPATGDDEAGLESASGATGDDTTPEAAPDATPEPVEVATVAGADSGGEAAAEAEPDSGVEPPTTEDQSATHAAADADRARRSDRRRDRRRDRSDALGVPRRHADRLVAVVAGSLAGRSHLPVPAGGRADDHLGFPVESPDAANRCASMHEAVPQSLRQQELVCLTSNHVNCPRYLRGAAETAAVVPVARVRPKAVMTPAISAALIILALSFGASVVFGLANGGLAMPSRAAIATPHASATSVAAEATASPASPTAAPSSAAASPSLGPTSAPSATPVPSPSATPIPSASASASAATGPTPTPTSSRYRLLKPCPNKPNCWIYTVRAGDNLYSIAKYFGVPLTTVHRLNPWTRTESLRAGKKLILPPPTR